MNDDDLTEEIEIELPEEDYQKLQDQAAMLGVSVDRMINDMLEKAINTGELDRLIKKYKENH